MESIKDEIDTKEKELNQLKAKLKEEKENKKRRELGEKYFDKHFVLNCVSDDYNIYPQESFSSIRDRFMDSYTEDDSYNKYTLEELRQEYVDTLRGDVDSLTNALEEIENQLSKIKKVK